MGVVDQILAPSGKSHILDKLPPHVMLTMAAKLLDQPCSILPDHPVPAVLMHNLGIILMDEYHPDARHARIPRWRNTIGVYYDGGGFQYSVYDGPDTGWFNGLRPWFGQSICLTRYNYTLEVRPDHLAQARMLPSCDPDEIDDGFYFADAYACRMVRDYLANPAGWQG